MLFDPIPPSAVKPPILILAGLAACASGGPSSVATPSAAPIVFVGGDVMPTVNGGGSVTHGGIMMADRPTAQALTVAATPDDVWRTAVRVYAALDIPVTLADIAHGQLGNRSFSKRRTLGPRRMSELLNCGSGQLGANADSYRIQMSLSTTLSSRNGQTLVETLLIAYGEDVSGDSTSPAQCASTGALENLINHSIQANLPNHPSPK